MKKCLIIPSGGKGERTKLDIPKQYVELSGKSILEYTLEKFSKVEDLNSVLISAKKEYHDVISKMITNVFGNIDHELFQAGDTRFHSVYNCINSKLSQNSDVIIIHDAVRPFVSERLINNILTELENEEAVVPYINPTDTIKSIDPERESTYVLETLDRSMLASVQTPQMFKSNSLIKAYQYAFENKYKGTDDASIIEYLGIMPKLVKGEYQNIKITTPEDMKFAKSFINE